MIRTATSEQMEVETKRPDVHRDAFFMRQYL